MSLRDILSLGREYLSLGIIVALFVIVLFLGYYFFYYKKHQNKRLNIRKMLMYGAFICYMVVVVCVTMLRGGVFWQQSRVMPLFYSYREAWNSFAAVDWRNIILNILMFVPFGFLLPFLSERFQKFWTTYLAGFLFTLLIESVQLIFKIGVFECDDLMNNFLGAMIGYGCYRIVRFVIEKVKRKEGKVLPMLCAQIPTVTVIALFAVIFGVYNGKELGNLGCDYILKLKNVEVESEITFSAEKDTAMVYQLSVSDSEETRKLAEEIFGKMGLEIDDSRTILYDDTAIYYSTDTNEDSKSLWIDYMGNTFSYTDFARFTEEDEAEIEQNTGADESEIRSVLESMGIYVPMVASFQYDEKNACYLFAANSDIEDQKLYQGSVTCEYAINGKMLDIQYCMYEYEAYKEFPIISQQEAFEKLEDGMFQYTQADSYEIKVEQILLEYHTDSKGFYQPVYQFVGTVNGEEAVISIPAIE